MRRPLTPNERAARKAERAAKQEERARRAAARLAYLERYDRACRDHLDAGIDEVIERQRHRRVR